MKLDARAARYATDAHGFLYIVQSSRRESQREPPHSIYYIAHTMYSIYIYVPCVLHESVWVVLNFLPFLCDTVSRVPSACRLAHIWPTLHWRAVLLLLFLLLLLLRLFRFYFDIEQTCFGYHIQTADTLIHTCTYSRPRVEVDSESDGRTVGRCASGITMCSSAVVESIVCNEKMKTKTETDTFLYYYFAALLLLLAFSFSFWTETVFANDGACVYMSALIIRDMHCERAFYILELLFSIFVVPMVLFRSFSVWFHFRFADFNFMFLDVYAILFIHHQNVFCRLLLYTAFSASGLFQFNMKLEMHRQRIKCNSSIAWIEFRIRQISHWQLESVNVAITE